MIHFSHSDDADGVISAQLRAKIIAFNQQHFEVKERFPIAISACNDQGELMAGISGNTFGNWLLIDWLWVDSALRGQKIGSRLLEELEHQAVLRGCKKVMVDTLEFQAPNFYLSHGYQEAFVMSEYPKTSQRYYFFKSLNSGFR